jgi:hypothetical protein
VRWRDSTRPVKRETLWCTISALAIRGREGQPWDKSESPSDGILLYLWKSRCRLLRNRSRDRRPKSRPPQSHPLPTRSPNRCGRSMMFISAHEIQNELARRFRHDGIRVGEIIAYRAWRVIERKADDRLHSVYVQDYVWPLDEPARGDVQTHGIYSFRDVIRCSTDYGYALGMVGPLLFGKVKIWGEIVEHEAGYRSEFAKIVSLDYGDPKLLEKFRNVYDLNQAANPDDAR